MVATTAGSELSKEMKMEICSFVLVVGLAILSKQVLMVHNTKEKDIDVRPVAKKHKIQKS
jgi:hypothetical protein